MKGGAVVRTLLGLPLIFAGLPGSAAAASNPALHVTITPTSPQPGDVVLIHVRGAPLAVGGEWGGRPLAFFPLRDGMAALVGVDLETPPGPLVWQLTRPAGDGGREVVRTGSLQVRTRTFATQRLTLPPGQVDLDAATLARVRVERAALEAALAESAGERLWRGGFRPPVEGGRPTGGFGLRRIINGQPRSPHAGYDWAAPVGTPVVAANAGRVSLVAEHFFAGRLVVLDHGLGLFTLYLHLDDTRVSPGERVGSGQPIGTVGATGRVTGPHLHFGVTLGAARVDPEALLSVKLPPEPSVP